MLEKVKSAALSTAAIVLMATPGTVAGISSVIPATVVGTTTVTTVVIGSIAMTPEPAAAAGWMENSVNNLIKSNWLAPSIRGGIEASAAFIYWMPPIWLIGGLVGIGVADGHGQGAKNKAVTIVVSGLILIMLLYLYDIYMVQRITSSATGVPSGNSTTVGE